VLINDQPPEDTNEEDKRRPISRMKVTPEAVAEMKTAYEAALRGRRRNTPS
jgi:hypothetical protein